MPGFEAMRSQQSAFFKAMTGGLIPGVSREPEKAKPADDLETIKAQLAEMQDKLSKLGK
jgi:polyhydroxyalkanoate synthesis regulator protein